MPGLNRKGPSGEGSMTGRRMGRCNPANKGKTDQEILSNCNNIDNISENSNTPSFGSGSRCGPGKGLGRGQGSVMGKGQANRFRGNI
jgi:hypothetical protein